MKALRPLPISPAALISSNIAEADHPEWVNGSPYTAGQRVIRTATHRVYECLVDGAGSTPPESDTLQWLDAGPTNRWAMFDDSPSSATTAAGSLAVVLAPDAAVDDVVLGGVVGTQVQVFGGAGGTTLLRTVAVPAPIVPATSRSVVLSGLGIAAGQRVGVTVTGPGTVQVAQLAVGSFVDLGQALPGCEVGITDHSVVQTDAFGLTRVALRPYSRWITGTSRIPAADVDRVMAEVQALQSLVTWWQVDAHECLQTLGWLKSFSIDYRGAGYALASWRLEGLSRDDATVQAGQVLPQPPTWALQTAAVTLYQRSATAPAGPTQAMAYTFAGAALDGLHGGWQASIPGGEGPLWATTATASGNARSVALRPADWAAPALLAQDAVTYDVEVESTNGTEFRVGQGTQTLLKAHVFRNDSEVTEQIPESWFRWRRVSLIPQPPPHDDATWNANYATGYRQVNVSVDDVQAKASFFCDIVRPD